MSSRRLTWNCVEALARSRAAAFALFSASACLGGDEPPVASLPMHFEESGTPTQAEVASVQRWLEALLLGTRAQSAEAAWSRSGSTST